MTKKDSTQIDYNEFFDCIKDIKQNVETLVNSSSEISSKIDRHDSNMTDTNDIIEFELKQIIKQNDELKFKIDYLKNEVKKNSMIRRIYSISISFLVFFVVAIILKALFNYNIGIMPWYKIGFLLSIAVAVMALMLSRELNNE